MKRTVERFVRSERHNEGGNAGASSNVPDWAKPSQNPLARFDGPFNAAIAWTNSIGSPSALNVKALFIPWGPSMVLQLINDNYWVC